MESIFGYRLLVSSSDCLLAKILDFSNISVYFGATPWVYRPVLFEACTRKEIQIRFCYCHSPYSSLLFYTHCLYIYNLAHRHKCIYDLYFRLPFNTIKLVFNSSFYWVTFYQEVDSSYSTIWKLNQIFPLHHELLGSSLSLAWKCSEKIK